MKGEQLLVRELKVTLDPQPHFASAFQGGMDAWISVKAGLASTTELGQILQHLLAWRIEERADVSQLAPRQQLLDLLPQSLHVHLTSTVQVAPWLSWISNVAPIRPLAFR